MDRTIVIMLQFFLAALTGASDGSKWDYENKNWGGICESGQRQSPIDIPIMNVMIDCSMAPLEFNNYDHNIKSYRIENNGHTAKISMLPNATAYGISGGGLESEYKLAQVHFHWSSTDTIWRGSEHRLSTNSYPLEAHFVHIKKGLTTDEALNDHSGLAVLSVLFTEISSDHNDGNIDTTRLNPLITGFKKIVQKGTSFDGEKPIDLMALLPDDRSSFYRYEGSLTTPPCSEAVIWTVMANPVPIHQDQLNVLRELLNLHDKSMDNYRETQPLNGRKVTLVRKECLVVEGSSANSLVNNIEISILIFIVSLFS